MTSPYDAPVGAPCWVDLDVLGYRRRAERFYGALRVGGEDPTRSSAATSTSTSTGR